MKSTLYGILRQLTFFLIRQIDYQSVSTLEPYWHPTPAFYFGVDVFFTKHVVQQQARWIFDTSSSQYMAFSEAIERISVPSTGQLMKFYGRLDTDMTYDTINPPTLLVLFGQWGSVWSFICLFVGSLAMKWNEHSFHEKYPHDLKDAKREEFSKFGKYLGNVSYNMQEAQQSNDNDNDNDNDNEMKEQEDYDHETQNNTKTNRQNSSSLKGSVEVYTKVDTDVIEIHEPVL